MDLAKDQDYGNDPEPDFDLDPESWDAWIDRGVARIIAARQKAKLTALAEQDSCDDPEPDFALDPDAWDAWVDRDVARRIAARQKAAAALAEKKAVPVIEAPTPEVRPASGKGSTPCSVWRKQQKKKVPASNKVADLPFLFTPKSIHQSNTDAVVHKREKPVVDEPESEESEESDYEPKLLGANFCVQRESSKNVALL
ncbi:hypothetical protein LTR56_021341 [Elasticomyces elasticus]|nr:hypothetical protein LTR56_021341 [Elasticomyces elasticus]KAK3631682.1 hypothetical protein LTR22_020972 [Elasticomyces elasticus]